MSHVLAVLARLCIALIFVVSGVGKLMAPDATAAMMAGVGLPGELALPAGLFELLAGVALAVGLLPRLVPLALIVFVALSTLFFHREVTDPVQAVQAMKNVAMIGGLLALIAWRTTRDAELWALHRTPVDERALDERVHEAELRAARAEGRAEVLDQVTPDARPLPPPLPPRRRWRWFG